MPLSGEYEPSAMSHTSEQVAEYEGSGGTRGTTAHDRPVIIVTTVGRKTGKLRKVALMRVEHDGSYAAVASLGGAPRHPVWYWNLKADPHVDVRDGQVVGDYLAREVTGAERDQWWDRAVAAFPDYAEYQRTTDRVIPVFVLDPA